MRNHHSFAGKRQVAVLLIGLAAGNVPLFVGAGEPPSPYGVRTGGALAEAFHYHRQLPYSPLAKVPRYSYGFPVPTYQWGWFGAKHYYPRTTSHRGYNGDYWQWAYRSGY